MEPHKKRIADDRRLLENPYAHLDETGNFSAIGYTQPDSAAPQIRRPVVGHHLRSRNPYAKIERLARNVQADLWKNRHKLWPDGVPEDPVDLLDPAVAIKYFGYDYELAEYLGDFVTAGKTAATAGLIDRTSRRISIARRFPCDMRRFTAAHELGHMLMHREAVMHRDQPIDGSSLTSTHLPPMEKEANKFASYFLMPEKLVRVRFSAIFGEGVFELNYSTAFALDPVDPHGLIAKSDSPLALARVLAKSERYMGQRMPSLVEQFRVSVKAMAIRLTELGLVSR